MKKGKFIKIGAGIMAVLISIIIVCNAIVQTALPAYAKESLPGVETIISNNGSNNPYTILEVVPEKTDAAIGYLIGGEEPLQNGKSYQDIPVQEERKEAFSKTLSENSVSSNTLAPTGKYAAMFGSGEDKALEIKEYQEPGDASRSYSLKGSFKPSDAGEYVELFQDADYKLIDPDYDGTSQRYKRYTEFPTTVKDGKVIILSEVGSVPSTTEREMTIPGETTPQPTSYKYLLREKWNGKDAQPDPVLADLEGKVVFTERPGYDRQYTYLGSIELITTKTTRMMSSVSDNSLSDNSLSDNSISKNEASKNPTLSENETPKEEQSKEETTTEETSKDSDAKDSDSKDSDAKDETTSTKIPDKTVSRNTYSEYAMLLDSALTGTLDEVYAIHCSDGKYLVFDASDVGTVNGVTTKLITDADSGVVKTDIVIAELEVNDAAGTYYISEVTDITGAPHTTPFLGFKQKRWYNPDETGDYYLAADSKVQYERFDPTVHVDPDLQRVNWVTDYSYPEFEKVTYQGGIYNHEWFKRFVFDRTSEEEYKNLVLDVKTVTMEEFNSYQLDGIDLVYFAGGETAYQEDMIPAQAQDVFLRVMKEKMPVIMNQSVAEKNTANENINKLSALLRQNNLDDVKIANDSDGNSALKNNWESTEYWTRLHSSVKSSDKTYGLHYVNRSIYIFDDVIADASGNAKKFVNLDFCKSMSAEQITYGFKEVEEEINNENLYRGLSGKDKLDTSISQATAIRYIINFASQRNVIKSKINVLEIQPCSTRNYTDAQLKQVGKYGTVSELTKETIDVKYIADHWATQFQDKLDAISLDSTYTAEFIGQIKDLNENYDLIFIGMDTTTLNTEIYRDEKTNKTVYNDSEMNGLVYSHTGDEIIINPGQDRYEGLLNPNNIDAESSMTEYYHKYRFGGNDITPDRLRDLREFVDAGYPIVFGDGFFTEQTDGSFIVNTNKVDKASNLYKLGQHVIQKGYMNERTFVDFDISNSAEAGVKKKLKNCLNLSKLSVDMTRRPTAYQDGVQDSYLKGENGTYQLEYELYLKNDAALSLLDTKYDCKLYIDSNVDGRFDSTEEIEGIQIWELQNGVWQPVYQTAVTDKNGTTQDRFQLMAGRYYKVQRQVPTGYAGVLPWKLTFEQTDNPLVRKSSNGYCAVPVPLAERQVIKVLQLTSGDSSNTTLDLTQPNVKALLDQVQDFDIQIEKMPVQTYIRTNTNVTDSNNFEEYSKKLNQYDMLIFGFIDMYQFESGSVEQKKAAALAIRKYINDGRSVLFTHDTTSYRNTDREWGYFFNRYIRDVVGMDRYGVMGQIAKKENFTQVDSVFDTLWKPDTSGAETNLKVLLNKQGYSNGRIISTYDSNYGPLATNRYMANSRPITQGGTTGQYPNNEMFVTELNQGQITEYPFKIPTSFRVSNTHNQYYQLNLDTDSRDNKVNDDIVVWYCISDVGGVSMEDCYQAMPNDARNNYYIYNKGNVTYSGVGHSNVNQIMEMKLFVNTMVAAYNAGVHPPRISYLENTKKDAAQIQYRYLPFDEAIGASGEFLEDQCEIVFRVSDTSFVQGSKAIETNYFLQVAGTTPGAVKTKVDGADVWLLKLNDSQITSLLEVDTNTVLAGADMHKVQNKYTYQMILPTSLLNLRTNNMTNLYIGAKTTYRQNGVDTVTDVGYYKMGIVRTQLFDLE